MYSLSDFESFPRLGLLSEVSPVHSLSGLAAQLGLRELWVKRDDLIPSFGGGNKVRKLDTLLAEPIYQVSGRWHSTGAIGSSQLVVGARIAGSLGRDFVAHACSQPFGPDVMRNLGQIQATASQVIRYRSRATMALHRPALMMRDRWRGGAVIPPGATSPAGNLGFVRAGIELAQQIREGGVPRPDRIYLALGSGGSSVGLAMGLALAEVKVPVHAISIVEPILVNRVRISGVERRLRSALVAGGISQAKSLTLELVVDTAHVGPGYAHPSAASTAACSRLAKFDLRLDLNYTGKAMAALLHDAATLSRGGKLLFWHTGFRL